MTDTPKTPGQRNAFSWDEYCALDRMNASTLKHGCKSMRRLKRVIKTPVHETPAMQFGSQYHTLILEPEQFEKTHCVMPDYSEHPDNVDAKGAPSTSNRTKWARTQRALFYRDNEGREVVKREDYDRALAMIEALNDDKFAMELVNKSMKEVTLLGEISGIEFKGRVDLLHPTAISDIKGSASAAPVDFGNIAARLNYGFSLAVYRELARQNGVDPTWFKFIVIETDGDFDCCVQNVPIAVIDEGWRKVTQVLQAYKFALERDEWDGVNKGASEVELFVPNWAMPDEDATDWS